MNRPFTFINSAMSADGKISTKERKQVRISGDIDFDRMDELRASSDAIMVGIGTVLADDPSLTVKSRYRRDTRKNKGLDEDPVRIIVDSKARTPLNADIFKKGTGMRIVAVSSSAPKEKVDALSKKATIITAGDEKVDLVLLMGQLSSMGIQRLMVEGGATLNWGLLSNGLVDEVFSFIGNIFIGGNSSPTLVDGEGFLKGDFLPLELISSETIEEGVLLKWKVLNK
ncbi:2,5-diamino-6-(ribosylamino)-4(3H)-pyrimidinone 5'-phosphate reductase [Methanococcoides burtonii]|uniref:2,5-diamino-6-(ribosylamino)-4(3H)-pyrimidinone 5'-phosphate reductase n=1 Tax=Methanococcoides burtonii (strain DSM 6242 / NBRC 107633 / OCM 468 / ACE-M) TaxID=259564 RepID=Q12TM0_METBU|nr:2,5-diamino-6-(ribosylamino)-4(3H)-pyrimidinone 5'-phosphate reductase [Methanococcoides burtonii]ABE53206.1 2,5-diamino-6-ribosylamino-4(3H)-pyrimidinone 5'-phosphate reductase [Methanococcoides burtonii DSM 6242]